MAFDGHDDHASVVAVLAKMAMAEVGHRPPYGPGGVGDEAARAARLDGTDLDISQICYGAAAFGAELQGRELDTCIHVFRDAGGNFCSNGYGP